MKKYTWAAICTTVAIIMAISIGCDAPQDAKNTVKDKHAQLYVFIKHMNDPDVSKHPTQAEEEAMLKACLKDMESLDILLNSWTPNSSMPSVTIDGKDSNVKDTSPSTP